MRIHLKNINDDFPTNLSKDIVDIINTDSNLRKFLYGDYEKPKIIVEDFIQQNRDRIYNKNSLLYAIILNNTIIGEISLTHIDNDLHTAQVGFWISSNYWGQGYTSKAFQKIKKIALNNNIIHLSSKIVKNNRASIKIFQKSKAIFREENDFLIANITL